VEKPARGQTPSPAGGSGFGYGFLEQGREKRLADPHLVPQQPSPGRRQMRGALGSRGPPGMGMGEKVATWKRSLIET